MVGKTRLFQQTGSPLIQGSTARRRRWPYYAVALAVLLVAAGVWAYLVYLR